MAWRSWYRVLAVSPVIALVATCAKPAVEPAAIPQPPSQPDPPLMVEPPAPPRYIEDCYPNFRGDPVLILHPVLARSYISTGDDSIFEARHAVAPRAVVRAVIDGVRRYSAALKENPYSAEATLKLAIVYDLAYRKGCALALLMRLAELAKNPDISPDASGVIDTVVANQHLFGGYRKDAIAALGR